MNLTSEQVEVMRDGEEFESLRQHPAFKKLVELARDQVLERWNTLLTASPDVIERVQGWIEGANFVLEYADAKVVQAELVQKYAQADQRAALESQFAAQSQQRQTGRRRVVHGATLD